MEFQLPAPKHVSRMVKKPMSNRVNKIYGAEENWKLTKSLETKHSDQPWHLFLHRTEPSEELWMSMSNAIGSEYFTKYFSATT